MRTEIKISDLEKFSVILNKEIKDRSIIRYFEDNFVKVSIINFFKGYDNLAQEQAKKRDKEIYPIEFTGEDLKINSNYYSELFSVLVHLFTNAIDHGIESPAERSQKGKDEKGTIKVSFEKGAFDDILSIKIVIIDDGGGIDPNRVRNKLIENGYDESTIEKNNFDIIQHIFDESFSTADQISLTSGRGVGMSAVKDTVEKMGGAIFVTSKKDEGTQFLIIAPDK